MSVLQDLTIGRWLGVIAQGGPDLISRAGIVPFLDWFARTKGEATNTPQYAKKVERHQQFLESVGVNQPDLTGAGDPLFLFENRAIELERGIHEVNMKEAANLAVSYLGFFQKLEAGRRKARGPGQFPRY